MYSYISDEDDEIEEKEEVVHVRSKANLAVLNLSIVTVGACNFTSGAIFPFFPIVAQEKTGSVLFVGYIFATLPFATAISSPFITFLTQKFGRIFILCIGLIGASISLAGFGFVNDVKLWFFLRALQGFSNALVDGPAVSLLLAHSSDVGEDIGLMEAAAGLAYVVGPAAGGALYAIFGFQITFLILGSVYILALGMVPFTVWDLKDGEDDGNDEGDDGGVEGEGKAEEEVEMGQKGTIGNGNLKEIELAPILSSVGTKEISVNGTEEEVNNTKTLNTSCDTAPTSTSPTSTSTSPTNPADEFSPWKILLSEPAVLIGSSANTLVWATTCFYDMTLSGQLKHTLGLGAWGRGAVYVFPSIIYAGFSFYLGGICKKYGPHNVLMFGCILHIIVLISCGPTPLLILIADWLGYGGLSGRKFDLICVMFAMSIWGFAMAPLYQAGLPLMHSALAKKGYLSMNEDEEEENDDEYENGKDKDDNKNGEEEYEDQYNIEKELVEDALSALTQGTSALGAILGPILGSLGLQYLPRIADPGCDPNVQIDDGDDDTHSGNGDGGDVETRCQTGFAWTTTCIALIYILLAISIVTLRRGDKDEDDEEEESSEKDNRSEVSVSPKHNGHNHHSHSHHHRLMDDHIFIELRKSPMITGILRKDHMDTTVNSPDSKTLRKTFSYDENDLDNVMKNTKDDVKTKETLEILPSSKNQKTYNSIL